MARQRMVTRTIRVGNFNVMAVNMNTRAIETVSVSIPVEGVKDIEAAVKVALPEGKVFVAIEHTEVNDVLMGIPEAEFIKIAQVLPNRE